MATPTSTICAFVVLGLSTRRDILCERCRGRLQFGMPRACGEGNALGETIRGRHEPGERLGRNDCGRLSGMGSYRPGPPWTRSRGISNCFARKPLESWGGALAVRRVNGGWLLPGAQNCTHVGIQNGTVRDRAAEAVRAVLGRPGRRRFRRGHGVFCRLHSTMEAQCSREGRRFRPGTIWTRG